MIAKVAMKPKATTLLYKMKTAASPATIRKTFKPSAINALVTAVAGSRAGLRNANHAAASPAVILIAPPSAAEIAPCVPAIQPSTTMANAVASSCHLSTVRIGWLIAKDMGLTRGELEQVANKKKLRIVLRRKTRGQSATPNALPLAAKSGDDAFKLIQAGKFDRQLALAARIGLQSYVSTQRVR